MYVKTNSIHILHNNKNSATNSITLLMHSTKGVGRKQVNKILGQSKDMDEIEETNGEDESLDLENTSSGEDMEIDSDDEIIQGVLKLKYQLLLQAYGLSAKRKSILDSYLDHIQKMKVECMAFSAGNVFLKPR